ncbi:hypothetical protein [Hymenobacter nivis]|uniref:Uncharacterized protein n=1 Tax=Hymenobacter nivis TaxID=1850093 RepID=A0A502GZD9_9BACT|nr:hypothetical protein [Hymenobacter nivis]TPG66383.1 hypothetical protein EAH73_08175 [Hymenobacter nivis]
MRRSLLAFLLLANYLLVVGAGLVASRPEVPRFSAAHPYVHSKACQQGNYLRLDCFEHCNGAQAAQAQPPTGTGLHFLAQLKGLDVHCTTAVAQVPGPQRPPLPAGAPAVGGPMAEETGFAGPPTPPPCWG